MVILLCKDLPFQSQLLRYFYLRNQILEEADQQLGLRRYCRTHDVNVCLYIAYIACGSASLYIKTLYFFLTVLALSAAATVASIKIRYDAKKSPIRYI